MASPTIRPELEISALPHPNPRVRGAGFDLDHPYLEQCWAPLLGPSGVLLLRRMPSIWREREPAVMSTDELARSLGLGASRGTHSRINRAIDRLVTARLATWTNPGERLGIYLQVPPVPTHRVDRLPEWSRRAHHRLLSEHLDSLVGEPSPSPPSGTIAALTARLDRLQRSSPTGVPALGR
jgi:hypothetical protein